ncbi:ATP synthase subunit C [Rubritalea tangerina]|uniref:ATP synthase subunit C n=1 Tax=Rubritalea tangerina TaxID=430798 RepID=A0ABW4Z7H0_9BACT
MDQFIIVLGWVGIFSPVALGAIGSVIGCSRAGQAACGAMLETESGHGRFAGVSAMPSSQTILGIVVTLTLNKPVTLANGPGIFAIGFLTGLALLVCAAAQGSCCAASINASKHKPEIFGLSIAPAAIVEGFAVFAFVFALVLAGSLPE